MKRLTIILLILLITGFSLQAQTIDLDKKIEISFDSLSLKEALNHISMQSGVKFSYSDSKLHTDKLVSGSYTNISFNQFLHEFLGENNINYSIIDQQIVLFPFNEYQTIRIRGKVINELDGSPIPFANIALPETNKGTSSNEDGEFELALTKLPSELMVSHLAHEKRLTYVYNDQQDLTITLMPAQRELKGITIKSKGSKNAYYHLLNKAYDKLSKQQNEYQYGKAFYRQKSSRNGQFTEIFEMFYDIKYADIGIQDWTVQEGRYAFQKNEEYDIFLYNKNFTLLSRMFPLMQPATDSYILPINPDVKKYFDLSLNEIINYENRYIAIIDYTPKPIVSQPAPAGQLYIDFEDYSILKFTGKFVEDNLEIIGFSDTKSAWDNYQLNFEISFIDDQSDNLQMDYVKIDHSFDYYFNKEFMGKVNTNSFLTFYEHYTPARNKKLGGAIDFKTSDMELIDRVGYNPDFWRQNPIVKRTPIEEKLILDFEQNKAFGAVFMNNEEEVVLLPDNQKSELAKSLITAYEAENIKDPGHKIFMRLNKSNYTLEDKIHFTAHIYDKWTFRPLVLGSVLTVELINDQQEAVAIKHFDINDGAAYGEFSLSEINKPGVYGIKAYTNTDKNSSFNTRVNISPFPLSTEKRAEKSVELDRRQEITIMPESGVFMAGVPTKIAFWSHIDPETSSGSSWNIIDNNGQTIQTIFENNQGIGSFRLTPEYDKQYYLTRDDIDNAQKYPLPNVTSSGLSLQVDTDRNRSVKLKIIQKPALIKDVFILSIFRGKVLSILQTKLSGGASIIDMPIQYLQSGINDFVIMDKTGKTLAKRRFFNPPDALNINLISSRWKSKRSHRLELTFAITDKNSSPLEANLSAICSHEEGVKCYKCDIRNELLFENLNWSEMIDFSKAGDSLYQVLDNLLILENLQNDSEYNPSSVHHQGNLQTTDDFTSTFTEPVFAEVSVSGSFSSQGPPPKKIKKKGNDTSKNEVFWVPKLNIDEKGIAIIELKVPNKNQKISINIQGLSSNGLIGNYTRLLDPNMIKTDRRSVR